MARLKFKQINSSISYNTSTNMLTISGSTEIIQTATGSIPALAVSGAMFIVDSPGIASASFNTSGSINVDVIDVEEY